MDYKSLRLERYLTTQNKDDNGFDISINDNINQYCQMISIRYVKLLDDYIYKNIPTEVLQGMKLKIENELLERRLKDNDK